MILPEGAESPLTENAASPFLAEPAQVHIQGGQRQSGLRIMNAGGRSYYLHRLVEGRFDLSGIYDSRQKAFAHILR
jgi:hypothetical protein